jgi:hypothetical protein
MLKDIKIIRMNILMYINNLKTRMCNVMNTGRNKGWHNWKEFHLMVINTSSWSDGVFCRTYFLLQFECVV